MTRLLVLLFIALPYPGKSQNAELNYDRTPKMYFLVELIPDSDATMDQSERATIQKEHMSNIATLAQENKLVMAGPFPKGGGLLFLTVPEYQEAVKLVEADPTVKAGLNTYTIRSWVTEKGLFTLENQ